MAYDHQTLEQKWQKFWEENKTFRTENPSSVLSSGTNVKDPFQNHVGERNSENLLSEGKSDPSVSLRDDKNKASFHERPKKYILDMFPYPSGAGLHVGHPKGYTATDIVSRYYHAKGYNVLHPMGFDAFGLPAENYAVKTGTHPRITTEANIATFTSQMKALGFSYDWDRMVDTTDPGYYQWTQWIFLELFKRGLAYEAEMPVNWCPALKAVLANEEVVDGKSEIGGHPVEKKLLRQWVLRITEYADRLITDLDGLDWPEGIKEMQRNWIGKSEGCEFRMMKTVNTKKGELPLSENGGGHNGLAKLSSAKSIFEDILKVNKKIKFSGSIEGYVTTEDKRKIAFRSSDILTHFRGKHKKEFVERSKLLGTVFSSIDQIQFNNLGIGYILFKTLLIRVVLGEQSNGNFFIKTYYVDDKLTAIYRAYLEENKKPTALILHGWDDVENRTNWHWMSSTKIALEKIGYDVIMEQLPGNNAPDLEKQLKFLDQYKDRIDEHSVIIGHSMGGFLGMHFVERLGKKIDKLICVAPIFNGLIDHVDWSASATGWEIGAASMRKNYNPEKVRMYVKTWKVFLSENDWGIQFDLAKKHFEDVGADITSTPNAGHFCESDGYVTFPALLDAFEHIRVYTTRVDTVYGMTYAVLAPDHPKIGEFIMPDRQAECEQYIMESRGKSDQDRTNEGKEKTGVFTGSYVVNPYNGESVPLWIADFVLGHYGTGALMAVPAHDERDFAFAKKYGIPLKISIVPQTDDAERKEKILSFQDCFTAEGILVNSREYDGLTSFEARRVLSEKAKTEGFGHKKINYKLRDWLFSRQRYWGEPIPLIHISNEDYAGLPVISCDENTKKSKVSYSDESEGVVRNDNLATTLLSDISIFENTKEVNKKYSKIENLTDLKRTVQVGERSISFDGYALFRYFLAKKSIERKYRANFGLTVMQNIEHIYFDTPEVGYLNIRGNIFRIILHKINENTYSLKTYYATQKLSKSLNRSYIKVCKGVENLYLQGRQFSQIYTGLTGKLIIDSSLPLLLPEVEKYEPSGDGQSPLATVPEWVHVKLAENLIGKRETNTMPQWGGSCWYYLRYMDAKNPHTLASREAMGYWQNVDEYVGGAEHAVLHLLYARFWHKVLYDAGVVPTLEPFQKLTNVGMILAYAYERADSGLVAVDLVEEREGKFYEIETGKEVKQVVAKMSKSLKNVVNPTDIVREYGADTLRLYEMSMGAFTDTAPWNTEAIIGVRRFLDKAYTTFAGEDRKQKTEDNGEKDMKKMKLLHKTIKKVGEDIVEYKFNTAISSLMILLNEGIPSDEEFAQEWKEKFVILLHPFAPHMAEELFSLLEKGGGTSETSDGGLVVSGTSEIQSSASQAQQLLSQGARRSIYFTSWPDYDEWMLVDDEVTIAVQVNGKLRGTLTCLNGVMQDEVSSLAHEDPNIYKWIEGKTLVKEIFIPNKMLSIVVKE